MTGKKTRDVNLTFSEADDVFADEFTDDLFIEGWRLANPAPAFPDGDLPRVFRDGGDSRLEIDEDATAFGSAGEDFTIEEKILAGYAQATVELGRATIIAGVRVEGTDVDLLGTTAIEEGAIINREFSRNYTDFLPSVNLKYDFTDRLVGRAAYYKAVVRPGFGEFAPSALIEADFDDLELSLEAGNPNLEPLKGDNFDIGLEFYPSKLSVFSVGAFYKDISNAIFGAQFEFEFGDDEGTTEEFLSGLPVDLGFIDGIENFQELEINTFVNVSEAEIYGIEFNAVQSLEALSPALEGFLISGNLTLSASEATTPDGRVVDFQRQSDVVWNAALGYDKGPWDLRVSANYRGDTLDELVDEDLDRIQDDRLLIEASAKFKISDNLKIYVEGKNLTDAPEYYYFGDESRLSQYDEFGSSYTFGFKYTY